ncbi:Guanosine-5'-triphosphate,3'-diphosphate pyrophosphatase [Metallosphaera sp. J1]|uniref:Ppx/GppA phosphatase family protein n=1 Tax=Metallosphaera TaxID=41980 RepID=UPI001EDF000F|nr:Ppx/GppA phosphatase family protein [Metallosphaera javensis (ex Hofmann et al. 2022)]MCG3109309.1 Guanosine-5'-triphosphate,3'-diphosphate pyrophosphatase [Metallosphaera javensis (ex Hofmann et al. 2022)]BCS93228.1 MAG: exopolyphosphatase [Metallosphaera javensis (ex Sakai et al. 2022)]
MEEVGVIDLGYNSIRLSVFQRLSPNSFRTVGSMKDFTRLGDGVDEGGEIKEERIVEAENVLSKFRSVLERRGVERVYPLGTSAFRLAKNGEEVAKRLSKSLGHEIQIIPGEEEGRLAALGSINSLPFTDGVVFELGGGSLELVYVKGREMGKVYHFPLGALRLTKVFKNEESIRKEVRNYLYTLPSWLPPTVVGSGGNVRSIGRFLMKMGGVKFRHVHGFQIPSSQIRSLNKTFWSMNEKEIGELPGIGQERAVTVKSAILVMEELLNLFDAPTLTISEFGMREGRVMKGEELSLSRLRDNWLEAFSNFMGIRPPFDLSLEAEKLTGSELAGVASFLAHVFMESGWEDPFSACYQYLLESLFPGFMKRDLAYVALICRGVTKKLRKKDFTKLGIEGKVEKVSEISKVVKTVNKRYPLGVF